MEFQPIIMFDNAEHVWGQGMALKTSFGIDICSSLSFSPLLLVSLPIFTTACLSSHLHTQSGRRSWEATVERMKRTLSYIVPKSVTTLLVIHKCRKWRTLWAISQNEESSRKRLHCPILIHRRHVLHRQMEVLMLIWHCYERAQNED